MPNTKSAIRRARRTLQQAEVNRTRKGKYKSTIKQMSIYLNSGKLKEAKKLHQEKFQELLKKLTIPKKNNISQFTVDKFYIIFIFTTR